MEDFDEPDNPLDIDGDGDEAIDMCLFFDKDTEEKTDSVQRTGKTGCCVILLFLGVSCSAAGFGLAKFIC